MELFIGLGFFGVRASVDLMKVCLRFKVFLGFWVCLGFRVWVQG